MQKLLLKFSVFLKALWFHLGRGMPKANKKQINERWAICNDCVFIDRENSQCGVCGCNISNKKIFMNKLAWADSECPKGFWGQV